MAAMEGSAAPDQMDWMPTYRQEVQLGHTGPASLIPFRRRKFDDFAEPTTERYRSRFSDAQFHVPQPKLFHLPPISGRYARQLEDARIAAERAHYLRQQETEAPQNDHDQHDFFGNDSNMSFIPRLTRRAAYLIYITVYVVVAASVSIMGRPVEYAATGIKRRLIARTEARANAAPPTTPRRRKYRNMYLTPPQHYAKRSARSNKIRDIPGRFPGVPLSLYAPRRRPMPRIVTIPAPISPTVPAMPGNYPESPPPTPPSVTCPASVSAQIVIDPAEDDAKVPIPGTVPRANPQEIATVEAEPTLPRPTLSEILSRKPFADRLRARLRKLREKEEKAALKRPRESVSSKSSSSSLFGSFQELELAPRRLATRQQQVAEREAIEQAERDKKAAEERAKEQAKHEKEDAEVAAQWNREREEYLHDQGARRFTKEPIIQPLTTAQDERLKKAMSKGQKVSSLSGEELTSKDWRTVLAPDAWLNDNIVVSYLEYVVKMAHDRVGLKRNAPPRMHAFNNNFFNNLRASGHQAVARWTRKPKIQGKDLLPLEYLFIPVNFSGNHWTLAVISPKRRTIEYFDSLHIRGQDKKVIDLMKVWLQGELGDLYKAEEWTVRHEEGPHQGNFSDCGVHTVTTAKMIALGIDPMAAPAEVMAIQRRRIVAELLNSGFNGEYEVEFEFAT